MKKASLFLILMALLYASPVFATGEAGTYFNVYIPPSNVSQGKDISLVVTAIYDSTTFKISDMAEDGDADDSASGILMAGQSYVLYLRDNGVNDDAPHADEDSAEQNGDHFIVTGNKLILVSQAAKSDWEHDWLPATNKSSKGTKFFVYANEVTTSPNDLNVMAYQDSTYVTITKISKSAHTGTGYTNVSLINDTVVAQFMISPGQDIIYKYPYGRDILKPGETYLVQSNKDVTVQYGALYTDEQDGGGFVPSDNGTGTGSLFYFGVPFEDSMQQEIRIVSWNDSNNVVLQRYNNGQWITVNQFNQLGKYKAAEWVGATNNETYATIFRVSCTAGKKVTVFEANWIETGSMVTSDIASMAPSSNGSTAGTNFAVYMPVPTEEGNVKDPLTGNKLPAKGTHAYIFANRDSVAHVTVKDAGTNGSIINRSYTVPAGGYVDCGLDSAQWVSIYNGTGTLAGGPNRPYLLINSDKTVSVEVTNFNDNWMMYFGAANSHGFDLTMSSNKPDSKPGDTIQFNTALNLNGNTVSSGVFVQTVDNGLKVLTSYLIDSTSHVKTMGTVRTDTSGKTRITYGMVSQFTTTHKYRVITQTLMLCNYHNGAPVKAHTILGVQADLNATVHGGSEMATANGAIISDSINVAAMSTFDISESTITEGLNLVCTAHTYGASYSWDFGDHNNGGGRIIDHRYEEVGNFLLRLTVTNAAGCSSSAAKGIKVVVVHCTHGTGQGGCNEDGRPNCGTSSCRDGLINENNDEKSSDPSAVTTLENSKTPNIWSNGNELYIDFAGMEEVNADIKIFNLLGQEIATERFTNSALYTREFENLAIGYYIIALKNSGHMYTKKLFLGKGRVW